MPKTARAIACIFVGVVALAWLFTLGLFFESSVDSSYVVVSGLQPTDDFISPFYIGSTSNNVRELGVPYLLYSRSDAPPFELQIIVVSKREYEIAAITINSIDIEFVDGHAMELVSSSSGLTAEFDASAGGDDEAVAYFSLQDCILRERDVSGTIEGSYDQKGEQKPFTWEFQLRFRRETHLYPGWLAIVYRNV